VATVSADLLVGGKLCQHRLVNDQRSIIPDFADYERRRKFVARVGDFETGHNASLGRDHQGAGRRLTEGGGDGPGLGPRIEESASVGGGNFPSLEECLDEALAGSPGQLGIPAPSRGEGRFHLNGPGARLPADPVDTVGQTLHPFRGHRHPEAIGSTSPVQQADRLGDCIEGVSAVASRPLRRLYRPQTVTGKADVIDVAADELAL